MMVAAADDSQEGCEIVPTEGVVGQAGGCLRSKSLSLTSNSVKVWKTDHRVEAPKLDLETCSISSELDCPICYQHFVEPVLAGCGRHTFCRNCLMKSESVGITPRCPICRAECQRNAAELPEVMRLTSKLRMLEGTAYEERLQVSRQEREEHLYQLQLAAAARDARGGRHFEVSNAGVPEVNGSYAPGILPTYMGPTVYRKTNSFIFIYRWQQTHWIIAELRGPSGMGEALHMLYRAPVETPIEYPPLHGWEIPPGSLNGRLPAPEVRLLQRPPSASGQARPRARPRSNSGPSGATPPNAIADSASTPPRRRSAGSDSDRTSREVLDDNWENNGGVARISTNSVNQTKCGPPCSIM
eukprot:TRINITY_DN28332_c0_g1_i1.p1 TRINITY_DN28332_c0_g1~~TRINITY_DN28332_c0_g1_i1.p1  ORF type:complete len:356 (+),score=47.69 TRINITY_DN28332_c0_g1_i1:136-1203(+)